MNRRKLVVSALLILAILSGNASRGSTTSSPAAEVIHTDEGPVYLGLQHAGEPAARIVAIAPGYPAWRAGIRCGDRVLYAEAGGARFPLADVGKYVDPGSPVKLSVARRVGDAWHVEDVYVQPSTRPSREPEFMRCKEANS